MADASSIAPTGYTVAATGVRAEARKGERIFDLLRYGIDAAVDIETARSPASVPDRGDIVTATGQNQPSMAAAARDVVANLRPWQWAGLIAAGVLTVGLFRGWFR